MNLWIQLVEAALQFRGYSYEISTRTISIYSACPIADCREFESSYAKGSTRDKDGISVEEHKLYEHAQSVYGPGKIFSISHHCPLCKKPFKVIILIGSDPDTGATACRVNQKCTHQCANKSCEYPCPGHDILLPELNDPSVDPQAIIDEILGFHTVWCPTNECRMCYIKNQPDPREYWCDGWIKK
jgi:hypothetical protein